ncbi:MAG: tail fiber domain-containing protein [Clostridia bacterium]|nr:tail fiber domain-containing protein [Clostridia bacterium]
MRYYEHISASGTAEQKLEQVIEYLYKLTDIMNYNLDSTSPEGIWKATNEALRIDSAAAKSEEQLRKDEYTSLRNLIVKSATNILKVEDSLSYTLSGGYIAESEDGFFKEDGYLNIEGTPYNIAQYYKYQSAVVNNVKSYTQSLDAYLKMGILEKNGEEPVFGMDIGYNKSSFIYDGTEYETIPSKVRITPERIGFYIENEEISYISKGKIYFPYATIEGGSININEGTFKVDELGNLTASSGTFSCSDGSSKVAVENGAIKCYVDDKHYGTIISAIDGNIDNENPMMYIVSNQLECAGTCLKASEDSWYIQFAQDMQDAIKVRHQFYGNVHIKGEMLVDGYIYNKGNLLIGVSSSQNVLVGSADRSGHTFIYSGENNDIRLYGKNIRLNATQYIYVPYGASMLFKTSSEASYTQGIYCGTVQSRIGMHVGMDAESLFLHGDVMLASGAAVTSDRRLKKDINTLDERYEKLFDLLEPKSFRYRMYSQKEHTGFIAQDIADALTVSGFDTENTGAFVAIKTTTGEEFALVYEEFIALNTFMIKKCLKRIEELEKIIKEKAV